MDSFALFQFAVDNASSVERSVALLNAQLPTHTDWVREYLSTTSHAGILFGFLLECMKRVGTEADLEIFRDFLQASRVVPDRWLIKAACDFGHPKLLEVLLEVPGALTSVDNWILLYVYEVPEFMEVFRKYLDSS